MKRQFKLSITLKLLGCFGLIVPLILLSSRLTHAQGPLESEPSFISSDLKNTMSIAWGDIDGDGDLDLAVGNFAQVNQTYRNDGQGQFVLIWASNTAYKTTSVAWGDVEGDGDLDLAVGNEGQINEIYLNEGGNLASSPAWISSGLISNTYSIAWGDADGDGALDLAVGNYGQVNQIYLNENGLLSASPAWTSTGYISNTSSIAWGDWDNDGDLDLAMGNQFELNQIFENNSSNGNLNFALAWQSTGNPNETSDIAWGDRDNDGDLDLAVANGSIGFGALNEVFDNVGGSLSATPVWTSTGDLSGSQSVAWGDGDGDGDLDLAFGNGPFWNAPGWRYGQNQIYENIYGSFQLAWQSEDESWDTRTVAWADMDGDGDLELMAGNKGITIGTSGQVNPYYKNEGLSLFSIDQGTPFDVNFVFADNLAWGDWDDDGDLDLAIASSGAEVRVNQDGQLLRDVPNGIGWVSPINYNTADVAWGDWDNDGDLDLAVGNYDNINEVYENDQGTLSATPVWTSAGDLSQTRSVAWGDVDNDGDLDLAVGNETASGGGPAANQLFENTGGNLVLKWESTDTARYTQDLAWGDVDNDGDLDLAVANRSDWYDHIISARNQIYENVDGNLSLAWESTEDEYDTMSLAWGDWDNDGDLDLAFGNNGQPNQVFENGGDINLWQIWESIGDIKFTWGVAWGDADGDGDLDLAMANGGEWAEEVNQIYQNIGGDLELAWETPGDWPTASVAWADWDNDGDLDLTTGGFDNMVIENTLHNQTNLVNNDLFLNLNPPTSIEETNFNGVATLLITHTIPISYTLFDPEGGTVGRVEAFYSPNGGGEWFPAVATNTVTKNLSLGSALAFDGADDWVETTDFDINNDFTLSMWVNPHLTNITQAFIGKHDIDGNNLLFFGLYGSGYFLYIGDLFVAGGTPTIGWQHLAVVGEQNGASTDVTVYKNGEFLWQQNIAQVVGDVSGGKPWAIGQDWDFLNIQSDFLKGSMDEVQIWSIARTQTEIQANMYRTLSGSEPNLVAYWPFDEGTGNTAFDQTANSNNGLLGGGVSSQYPKWTGGYFKTYTYHWNTFASGFFGQSDNVVFRLEAYPQPAASVISGSYRYLNAVPGPFQRPYASATTFPFRVRGTQVQVFSETVTVGNEAENVLVYRLPTGNVKGGFPLGNTITTPFRTDGKGYLQGRGTIGLSDTLFALLPVAEAINHAGELAFNGLDDVAQVTAFNNAPQNEATIALWLKTSDSTAESVILNYARPLTTIQLQISNPHNLTIWRGNSLSVTTGVSVTNGLWHHLALSWRASDGELKLYKNGLPAFTGTLAVGSVISADGSLTLGGSQSGGAHFTGSVDEISLWNTVRSEAEIQADMFQSLAGDEVGLVGYWPLNEPSTQIATDNSANGNHLNLYGPVWLGGSLGGYTVYHTNFQPTESGLGGFVVEQAGVQVITVTAQHPLILFDLNVSLEWDGRKDSQFLDQLQFDLGRASEVLFDASNGQAALGQINIYHAQEHWFEADIRIYASNALRPHAAIGGIRTNIYTEVITSNPYAVQTLPYTLTYGPGQVNMGSIWNRFGESTGTIGEDWPRTLVHELGHYLFYLEEDYLGLDDNGLAVSVSGCNGTLMSNPYRDDYSEFHPQNNWDSACATTLQAQQHHRSDWEYIEKFYPWLKANPLNGGPRALPLDLTQISEIAPSSFITPTIDVPIFFLTAENGATYQPATSAQAILYQGERLIDLGRPVGDKLRSWGARPGDRLCVYEATAQRLGCEVVENLDDQLMLVERVGWQPDIVVTPLSSVTIGISVTANLSDTDSLQARLYPGNNFPSVSIGLSKTNNISLSNHYSGAFQLEFPAESGYIQLWVAEADSETQPRREAITTYALGGNPGFRNDGWGFRNDGWGFRNDGWGFRNDGWGFRNDGWGFRNDGWGFRNDGWGFRNDGFAPAISTDGQVILFGQTDFEAGQFYALQKTASLPAPPSGRSLIGDGYRVLASPNAPDLSQTSLNFRYLGQEVAPGEEAFLSLYHWDGSSWTKLPTTLNLEFNEASAGSNGPGLYALMSSIEIALYGPGWNIIAYPVQETRPVSQALLSISGYYTTVYGYVPTDTVAPWRVYDVTVPAWVNDLTDLHFGQGYWIQASQTSTLYLQGSSEQKQSPSLQSPPSTFYGIISAGQDFTPTVGMMLTAWVNGRLCGQALTQDVNGQIGYAIKVNAAGPSGTQGCGAEGDTVSFKLNNHFLSPTPGWDNSQVWHLPLTVTSTSFTYLPLVLK